MFDGGNFGSICGMGVILCGSGEIDRLILWYWMFLLWFYWIFFDRVIGEGGYVLFWIGLWML